MAANTTPIFTLTPIVAFVQVSTANTARDGTGTIADIATGDTNGTRVDYVRIVGIGTTTVGVVRLFISDGVSTRLLAEILVTAITPSTTVAVFSAEFIPTRPIVLPSGYKLRGSTHNAETFNLIAYGGSY